MSKEDIKSMKGMGRAPFGGGAYFLAFIGAAVYFVQQSEGFWAFILALLKAIVWPAFLIHGAFEALHL